jgi:uncharacterized protein (DUF2235 family)
VAKNIVVCCDGTGNEYGEHNTNVVNMYKPVIRNQDQVAYYDPGVGTFSVLGRTLGKKLGVMMGQGFGYGLTENIEDAYLYLMDHYEPGDKVFLFGFSRGAFMVRALAGMLNKVGLLQKGSNNLISYASQVYNTRGNESIAEGFQATYCHECHPHFIGVWDTVGSLGWFYGKQFFDDRLNKNIINAYHAIAIDEKRQKFPVSLWNETELAEGQTVEQVWFSGVHSDIGGSYQEHDLSTITLIWMLENAEKHGLLLKENWRDSLVGNPLGAIHESRTGMWNIWPPVTRQIPEGAKIHRSAITRMQTLPEYSPTLPTHYVEVD